MLRLLRILTNVRNWAIVVELYREQRRRCREDRVSPALARSSSPYCSVATALNGTNVLRGVGNHLIRKRQLPSL